MTEDEARTLGNAVLVTCIHLGCSWQRGHLFTDEKPAPELHVIGRWLAEGPLHTRETAHPVRTVRIASDVTEPLT